MWFILRMPDETTLAMTAFKDAAEIIAASFTCECVMRFSAINDSNNSEKTATVSAKAAIA